MGQRANIVIIQGGNWSLYYDHWCANLLDVELFWGPEAATAFAMNRAPLDDRNDWLDECWGEGGAIIDHDKRTLLWFGGGDILYDVALRRAHIALMQRQWSDWRIEWALGDIAELGAYVGVPMETFLVTREPDARDRFRLSTEYPEDTNALVTVRKSGKTTATQLYGDPEAIEFGIAQLPSLLDFPRSSSLDWQGEMPQNGLHLDLDERRLFYWSATPVVAFEQRVRQGWPGWRCEWLRDRYEEHLRLASLDIRLPHRDLADLQRACIAHVRRWCDHEASNPARELASMLPNTAISHWTEEARGSVGSAQQKFSILDALERELPVE